VEAAVRLALRGRDVPDLTWKHTYGHIGYRGVRERIFETATGSGTRYGAVCHTQVRYLTGELGLPADRISVVPNGIPVPADLPAAASVGRPTVLMVAAMRADKDHALALRAWPSVLAHEPDAVLRLAGDGPCRSDLERLAAELGIADRVEFLGVRSDVGNLLKSSHLLVLASYAVECFPYAVLEGMAAGRGVVSTNVAGLPELIDDGVTGRLVPPHDPSQLAGAIIDGLTGTTWRSWGAAGWQRARTVFPLDRWAQQIADLIDDVAGEPAPAVRSPSARKTLQ
jgi:glycosyltransferase involved in cell wall biosynthesis